MAFPFFHAEFSGCVSTLQQGASGTADVNHTAHLCCGVSWGSASPILGKLQHNLSTFNIWRWFCFVVGQQQQIVLKGRPPVSAWLHRHTRMRILDGLALSPLLGF